MFVRQCLSWTELVTAVGNCPIVKLVWTMFNNNFCSNQNEIRDKQHVIGFRSWNCSVFKVVEKMRSWVEASKQLQSFTIVKLVWAIFNNNFCSNQREIGEDRYIVQFILHNCSVFKVVERMRSWVEISRPFQSSTIVNLVWIIFNSDLWSK